MITIENFAVIFKLMGDKTRLTILLLLSENELCICDIVEKLQTSQSNISQHMRKLKDGGLVKESKRAQWVYYSLTKESTPYISIALNHISEDEIKLLTSETSCNC